MITAKPGTALHLWCKVVDNLKEGEAIQIDQFELRDIASYDHNGAWFYPPDRILGNIVGSAYTHSYSVNPIGDVTFYRHRETGVVHYKDPDRR